MSTTFDFENPITILEEELEKLKQIQDKTKVDFSTKIIALENKIVETKNEVYGNLTRWQKVQMARHPDRPQTLDYISMICDEFVELHGDRNVRDDKAIVGGLASISQMPVMIIGHQKGKNTKERQFHNFGMANPEGYRKALRLMKLAEKFNRPVIALIDTMGAYPGIEAEARGQGEAIARNLFEMTTLQVPILCFIIGEGASGGALGLAIGDRVYMLEYSWYSVISPESCSSILWRNWDHKEQAAEALKLSAEDMLSYKLIDGIIKEPLGGAHKDPALIAQTIKTHIIDDLNKFSRSKIKSIVDQRINKFSSMGVILENNG